MNANESDQEVGRREQRAGRRATGDDGRNGETRQRMAIESKSSMDGVWTKHQGPSRNKEGENRCEAGNRLGVVLYERLGGLERNGWMDGDASCRPGR